jgi:predicted tellurium resistance membrane protein TerC
MKDNVKAKIAQLLDTKMDRKSFLKYTAATGLMAIGGGVILKSADHFEKLTGGSSPEVASGYGNGYGTSAYGGQR